MSNESCEVLLDPIRDEEIEKALGTSKTIAVIGLSTIADKASHRVSAFMQSKGYRIIPVHPSATEILGEKAYPTLDAIPEPVDIVNVFRPPSELIGITENTIRIGAKVLWAQEGIVSNEAAALAKRNGITSIMGKCLMKEYKKLHPDSV